MLDADGHAGWELACALLRPRRIVADDDGNVSFMRGGAQRISVDAALKHPFITKVRHGRIPLNERILSRSFEWAS